MKMMWHSNLPWLSLWESWHRLTAVTERVYALWDTLSVPAFAGPPPP